MSRRSAVAGVAGAVTAAFALAGCTSTAPTASAPGEPGPIAVKAADTACDVSAAVPPDSWYGTLLKGIFNFSPQTTVLEAVVWGVYVAVVLTLFLLPQRTRSTTPSSA